MDASMMARYEGYCHNCQAGMGAVLLETGKTRKIKSSVSKKSQRATESV